MRFNLSGSMLRVTREPGDAKFYGGRGAAGEHRLFYHIKRALQAGACPALGTDWIKRRTQDDGHLMGDEYQPYLRARRPGKVAPDAAWALFSPFYALRGAAEDWNAGEVALMVARA